MEIRIHVIVFTLVETIIHQISTRTSLISQGLRLLILYLLHLLSPPVATISTRQISQLDYEHFLLLQTA